MLVPKLLAALETANWNVGLDEVKAHICLLRQVKTFAVATCDPHRTRSQTPSWDHLRITQPPLAHYGTGTHGHSSLRPCPQRHYLHAPPAGRIKSQENPPSPWHVTALLVTRHPTSNTSHPVGKLGLDLGSLDYNAAWDIPQANCLECYGQQEDSLTAHEDTVHSMILCIGDVYDVSIYTYIII